MTHAERQMWFRVRFRLAQETGAYLAEQESQNEQLKLWFFPLVRAWSQVDELLRTGRVMNFYDARKLAVEQMAKFRPLAN